MFVNKNIKTSVLFHMPFKKIVGVLLISILNVFNSYSNDYDLYIDSISKKKTIFLAGGLGLGLVSGYYYANKIWWESNTSDFHFDQGSDLTYALNLDKMGHFLGGVIVSDVLSNSFSSIGLKESKSFVYATLFSSAIQLGIEIKDGYGPYWGFSKWDLISGTMGSFWPISKYYVPKLQGINFKFSYFKNSNKYLELEEQRGNEVNYIFWQDDYINQTYWITFDVNHFIETCCWPKWMNLAIGFGIDDSQFLDQNNKKTGGSHEIYLSLDYNLSILLEKWETPFAKKIKYWINYFHFPAPAIRITPKIDFYPLFL